MKKILSIDGGGIKGVFPASFLARVDEECEGNLAEYFDLIVGTSTGGIIALGLGLGLSPAEILKFYEEYGPEIFYGNPLAKIARWIFSSKYDNKALKASLEATFAQRLLGESNNRLVIPAMNPTTGEVHIFKTSHHPHLKTDYKCPVVDVALGTSAAPTFFPVHVTREGVPLLDGGLWANNPIGLAVVEAIGMLKWPADEIRVLSIGCTSEPLNVIWASNRRKGLWYWSRKISQTFMTPQSSGSLGTAYTLLSHEAVHRFDPTVSTGQFSLDSTAAIPALSGLGQTEARKAIQFISYLFDEKAEPFKPVHKLEGDLR